MYFRSVPDLAHCLTFMFILVTDHSLEKRVQRVFVYINTYFYFGVYYYLSVKQIQYNRYYAYIGLVLGYEHNHGRLFHSL